MQLLLGNQELPIPERHRRDPAQGTLHVQQHKLTTGTGVPDDKRHGGTYSPGGGFSP
ncbi:hypothetical protein SFR_3891 [Streptomyces sp. FR-008]|nr:hypothetical protein SFR_3891 [Streptomyces sp. FR-008]